MSISGLQNQYHTYYTPQTNQTDTSRDIFGDSLSKAVKQTEVQTNGKLIGLTTIPEPNTNHSWGMIAKFSEDSTEENPIVYVHTNYGNETIAYNISINDIDPKHASRLELFALCSYADQQGMGTKSTFGTYQKLKVFEEMSIHNGYFDKDAKNTMGFEQFINAKLDWVSAFQKVQRLLYECNDLGQYKNGLDILNLFSKYPVK